MLKAIFYLVFVTSITSKIAYIVVGPAGSGKTTIINYLCTNTTLFTSFNQFANITHCTTIFDQAESMFVDTIGLLDTSMEEQEAQYHLKSTIEKLITQFSTAEIKIIGVLSLADTRIHYAKLLKFLNDEFDKSIYDSTVILLSQVYKAQYAGKTIKTAEEIETRINEWTTNHGHIGKIPVFPFEALYRSKIEMTESLQLELFASLIKMVRPYVHSYVLKFYQQIEEDLEACIDQEMAAETNQTYYLNTITFLLCNLEDMLSSYASKILIAEKIKAIEERIKALESQLNEESIAHYQYFLAKQNRTLAQRVSYLKSLIDTQSYSYNKQVAKIINKVGGFFSSLYQKLPYNKEISTAAHMAYNVQPCKLLPDGMQSYCESSKQYISSAANDTFHFLMGAASTAYNTSYSVLYDAYDAYYNAKQDFCKTFFPNISSKCSSQIKSKINSGMYTK